MFMTHMSTPLLTFMFYKLYHCRRANPSVQRGRPTDQRSKSPTEGSRQQRPRQRYTVIPQLGQHQLNLNHETDDGLQIDRGLGGNLASILLGN